VMPGPGSPSPGPWRILARLSQAQSAPEAPGGVAYGKLGEAHKPAHMAGWPNAEMPFFRVFRHRRGLS
jgi:hypothetical protein